jgi:cell division protein FtsB
MEKKRLMIYGVVIAVAATVIFLPGFSDLQKLREENDQLQKRIELLERRNEDLTAELRKMEHDPEHIERKAREKLGIVKKGEMIYRGDG